VGETVSVGVGLGIVVGVIVGVTVGVIVGMDVGITVGNGVGVAETPLVLASFTAIATHENFRSEPAL
jgi:hypothetical protein